MMSPKTSKTSLFAFWSIWNTVMNYFQLNWNLPSSEPVHIMKKWLMYLKAIFIYLDTILFLHIQQ